MQLETIWSKVENVSFKNEELHDYNKCTENKKRIVNKEWSDVHKNGTSHET